MTKSNELFPIVKKYIDRMDYYALLAGGAPSDEFDSESREISERVCCDRSAQQIADIIASVFNKHFNENDAASVFLPVAEKIKSELTKCFF